MKKKYHQGVYIPVNKLKYKGNYPICYRSSWELKFFRFCDSNSHILEWSSEKIVIPYINPVDGRVHRYFTDGNVLMRLRDGGTKKFLIEIKPAKQLQPPNPNAKRKTLIFEQLRYAINQSKFKTAEQWANKHGYTFLILTEKELNIE